MLILEQSPYLGGYLNPFRWQKYSFDTELHYIGKLRQGGSFRTLIQGLGLEGRIGFIELNPEGFGHYHFGDLEFILPADKARFKERLFRKFPDRHGDINRFFNVLHDMEQAVAAISGSKKGIGNKLKTLRYLPALAKYSRMTYKQLLDGITDHPGLRAVFSVMSGETGLPPSRASAFPGMMVLSHYLNGAFYPEGGGGGLRDAMVNLIAEKGGYFMRNFKVTRIRRQGELFEVTGEKGAFKAKTVINNTDPKVMFGQLADPGLGLDELRKKADNTQSSMGAFYAFVGTDLDLPKMGLSEANIIHEDSIDTEENWRAVLDERLDTGFKAFLITSPSLKDPVHPHAPKGKYAIEIVSIMSIKPFMRWASLPARRRGEEYEALKRSLGMKLLEKAEKYIPGLRDHLDFVEFATPLSNLYWVNAPAGGCYGPDQTPSQMGPGRFRTDTPVKGLFMAGAGVYGGGVFPAMASGMKAAHKALEIL